MSNFMLRPVMEEGLQETVLPKDRPEVEELDKKVAANSTPRPSIEELDRVFDKEQGKLYPNRRPTVEELDNLFAGGEPEPTERQSNTEAAIRGVNDAVFGVPDALGILGAGLINTIVRGYRGLGAFAEYGDLEHKEVQEAAEGGEDFLHYEGQTNLGKELAGLVGKLFGYIGEGAAELVYANTVQAGEGYRYSPEAKEILAATIPEADIEFDLSTKEGAFMAAAAKSIFEMIGYEALGAATGGAAKGIKKITKVEGPLNLRMAKDGTPIIEGDWAKAKQMIDDSHLLDRMQESQKVAEGPSAAEQLRETEQGARIDRRYPEEPHIPTKEERAMLKRGEPIAYSLKEKPAELTTEGQVTLEPFLRRDELVVEPKPEPVSTLTQLKRQTSGKLEPVSKGETYLPKDELVVDAKGEPVSTPGGFKRQTSGQLEPLSTGEKYLPKDETVVDQPVSTIEPFKKQTSGKLEPASKGERALARDEKVVEPKKVEPEIPNEDRPGILAAFKKQTGVKLTSGVDFTDVAASIARAGKTMIARGKKTAVMIRNMADKGIVLTGDVLHSGRGKDVTGTETLKGMTKGEVFEYDPNVKGIDKLPKGKKFDNIVQNYVLNTVEPSVRDMIIKENAGLLKKNGNLIVSVRGIKDVSPSSLSKWTPSADGYITSKGTFQKFYTPETLKAELSKHFNKVEILDNAAGSTNVAAIASEPKTGGSVKLTSGVDLVSAMHDAVRALDSIKNTTVRAVEKARAKVQQNFSNAGGGFSVEAMQRLEWMKKAGIKFFKIDMRSGKITTVPSTIDVADLKANPHEVIVQTEVGKGGKPIIYDEGIKAQRAATEMKQKRLEKALENRGSQKFGMGVDLTAIRQIGTELADKFPVVRDWIESKLKRGEKDTRGHLIDRLYVEDWFNRHNSPETGHSIKTAHSFASSIEAEIYNTWHKLSKSVGNDKAIMGEAVLIAENKTKLRKATGEVGRIARELRQAMDDAKQAYEDAGFKVNFKERFRQTITDLLKDEKNPAERTRLKKILTKLQDFEFVHIPYNLWFEDMLLDPSSRGKTLDILARKKRGTFTIEDLIKEEVISKDDLHAGKLMAHYGRRLGKDLAFLRMRKAALKEGLMTKDVKLATEKGFQKMPSYEAPALAGYYIDPTFVKIIRENFVGNIRGNWINQMVSSVKMLAFDNPLYLGWYDLHQAYIFRGADVRILSDTWRGFKEMYNATKLYRQLEREGMTSKPYPNSMRDFTRDIEMMGETLPGRILKTLEENTIKYPNRLQKGRGLVGKLPVLPDVYNVMWDAAWSLDAAVRTGTAMHCMERLKMSPREAAQTSALYHGDYANVPRPTRIALNKLLFTPTFKIAMIKLHSKLIKAAVAGSQSNPHIKMSRARAAYGLANILIANYAMDYMMTNTFGFKRDAFGRRYVKEIVTDKGLQELVVSFSSPNNLIPKYADKLAKALGHRDMATVSDILMNGLKGEITPLISYALDMAENRTVGEGHIYEPHENNLTKFKKLGAFYVRKSIGYANDAFPMQSTQDAKIAFGKEMSQGAYLALNTIGFTYLRDNVHTRFNREMGRQKSEFDKSLQKFAKRGDLTTEKFNELYKNYMDNLQGIIGDYKHYTNK